MTSLNYRDYARDIDAFCTDRESFFYLKADANLSDDLLQSLQHIKKESTIRNVQSIKETCRKIFGQNPLHIDPLERHGTFHLLYRLVFSDARNYIIRMRLPIFRYLAWDFYIDRWVVKELLRGNVPIPKVYEVDLSHNLCPFEYEILGEAPGVSLTTINIDHLTRKKLVFELGQTIAEAHSIKTSGFGMLDVRKILSNQEAKGLHQTWEDYIFLNLDRHIKICCDIGAISFEEAKRIRTVFEQTRHVLEHVTPSLLHGDLGNHNIFTDDQHITAVIDWEDCLSGDRLFDIASWGTFYGNDDWREDFLAGYNSVLKLPEDSELRYWLYYLRVALAKTVHRHRFRYQDHPHSIRASHRIQKGLQNIESIMRKKVL